MLCAEHSSHYENSTVSFPSSSVEELFAAKKESSRNLSRDWPANSVLGHSDTGTVKS